MEKKRALKEKIRSLQEEINSYIKQNDFSRYNELLKLSRELDDAINEFMAANENAEEK